MKKTQNTETRILKLFGNNYSKTFTTEKLKSLLPTNTRKEKLYHSLSVLKKQNKIEEIDIDTYKLKEKQQTVQNPPKAKPSGKLPPQNKDLPKDVYEGTLDRTRSGRNYVLIDGMDVDPILKEKNIPAFSGDEILVKITKDQEGSRPHAKFMGVKEHKQHKIVGKLLTKKINEIDVHFVIPHSHEVHNDFYISQRDLKGAKNDDYVIAEMVEWRVDEKNPRGRIIEILDNANMKELEMQSILAENGFVDTISPAVQRELDLISKTITKQDIESRLDFRDTLTLTIDPATARDFDDALSLKSVGEGKWEIGVHIADVSHYVPLHSSLDEEAYQKATSVYLPDRVAPMLPEKLSNDICSLNPNEDRLAFAVIFTVDSNGKILKDKIATTIIHSDKRYAYEDAQKIIETGVGEHSEAILTLFDIAGKWRKKRMSEGSINFHSSEVQFVLDDKGNPIDIIPKVQKEANWLIEEYMLQANVSVANYLDRFHKEKKIQGGIYRIHDYPDIEKLNQFRDTAFRLSQKKLPEFAEMNQVPKVLNSFLAEVQDNPNVKILNQMAIRSMAKAEYSTNNIGHFGLAFDYYSHFTSPIRRYPDLIAHRLLKQALYNQKTDYTDAKLKVMAQHCSQQEKKAVDCEREGIRYMQLVYMKQHIGEIYDGTINGMRAGGFWVEITANQCEGYVDLEENFTESFTFDPSNLKLRSTKTNREFQMGDHVKVQIDRIDLNMGYAWFILK